MSNHPPARAGEPEVVAKAREHVAKHTYAGTDCSCVFRQEEDRYYRVGHLLAAYDAATQQKEAAERERDDARHVLERIRVQAGIWKQEARSQKATVDGVGAALGGVADYGPIVASVEALVADRARMAAALERIIGMCDVAPQCACGRPNGLPAVVSCARKAITAATGKVCPECSQDRDDCQCYDGNHDADGMCQPPRNTTTPSTGGADAERAALNKMADADTQDMGTFLRENGIALNVETGGADACFQCQGRGYVKVVEKIGELRIPTSIACICTDTTPTPARAPEERTT